MNKERKIIVDNFEYILSNDDHIIGLVCESKTQYKFVEKPKRLRKKW